MHSSFLKYDTLENTISQLAQGYNKVVKDHFQTQSLGTMLLQSEESLVRRNCAINKEHAPHL